MAIRFYPRYDSGGAFTYESYVDPSWEGRAVVEVPEEEYRNRPTGAGWADRRFCLWNSRTGWHTYGCQLVEDEVGRLSLVHGGHWEADGPGPQWWAYEDAVMASEPDQFPAIVRWCGAVPSYREFQTREDFLAAVKAVKE